MSVQGLVAISQELEGLYTAKQGLDGYVVKISRITSRFDVQALVDMSGQLEGSQSTCQTPGCTQSLDLHGSLQPCAET